MDMNNSVVIAAPQARVWEALNDPETLKRCIAGCESIEKTADNAYKVAMTVAIGPVKAKFKGELLLEDIVAPDSYTIRFSGQGGVAGFGKGSARVTLSPEASEASATRLDYTVDAQVGGKIAQVGSRLIDGASRKMADDFFNAFRREVEGPAVVVDTPDAAPAAGLPSAVTSGHADPSASAFAAVAHPVADPLADPVTDPVADPIAEPAPGGASPTASEAVDRLIIQGLSNERWTWLAIAVALASTMLLMVKR